MDIETNNSELSILNSALEITDPIIRAWGLVKIYKTKAVRLKALNGVDLDIMPGEFLAIVGTSGSGKSTLLSLLAGLEKPDEVTGLMVRVKSLIYDQNSQDISKKVRAAKDMLRQEGKFTDGNAPYVGYR